MTADAATGAARALHDCAPSARQTLLLEAVLAPPVPALAAWRRWLEEGDLENMDAASFRLLPMIYRKFSSLNEQVPALARLRIVYRHSWFRNQVLFAQARELLAALDAAGIACLLLKGGALTLRHYRDDGIRYMADIDVLVAPDRFEAALAVLANGGWQPRGIDVQRLARLRRAGFQHGWGFRRGQAEVDLHAQLTRFVREDDLWAGADGEAVNWRGVPVRLPSDTLLLYHACVHGARWSEAKLGWIPDAIRLLGDDGTTVDWELLIHTARVSRTVCQLRPTLCYLAERWQAPVPEGVLRNLHREPTSWVERQEYAVMARAHRREPLLLAKRWYLRACRYAGTAAPPGQRLRPTLFGLAPYLYYYVLSGGSGQ